MRNGKVAIGAVLTLLLGVWIGWTIRDVFAHDACLDRINYDKALSHLCGGTPPKP